MFFKLSHYVVFSGQIDKTGRVLVFSTRSGKILFISPLCHKCLISNSIQFIPTLILNQLIEAKVVVEREEHELETIVKENITSSNNDNGVLRVVIQPSANCQLGCYYCGQSHSKNSISERTYTSIINRIVRKLDTGEYDKLDICWFGGEPLMALDEVREITQKLQIICAERAINYMAHMVSNGLSLKAHVFTELARDLGVRSIEITLDGLEDDHNKHRYTKGGGKSFATIYSNLKSIVCGEYFDQLDCKITIRCNIDEANKDSYMPLMVQLKKDGIASKAFCYPASIYSWGNDAHKGAVERNLFAQKELIWKSELFQMGFNTKIIPGRKKRLCLATIPSEEMVDAFGNIYNCTEIPYVPAYDNAEYKLGVVGDDTYFPLPVIKASDAANLANWNNTLRENVFPCHSCNMLPVCGGGCPKQWYEGNAPCPSAKYVMPERLLFYYLTQRSHEMKLAERQELVKFHNVQWVTNLLSVES